MLKRARFATLVAGGVAGAVAGCARRPPQSPAPLGAAPAYADAVARVRAGIAADAADARILPAALPRLYEHGRRVRHAVVLLHGFTNCPQQFDELAHRYHARGCNVVVPRIVRHGYRDRLTRALGDLTVDELEADALAAFAAARGLGDTVSVVGLSLGGTMALWLAQTQPVDLVVAVAPFLMPVAPAPGKIPIAPWIGDPAMRALHALPDMYWWWDPRLEIRCKPDYAYPGYPTHALAEMVFLGDAVVALAGYAKPRARNCVAVLNDRDSAVNNAVTRALLARWTGHGAAYRELVLHAPGPPRHDIIDPTTYPQARTAVYPVLEALVLR